MLRFTYTLLLALALGSNIFAQATNTAIIPSPQNSWMEKHEAICKTGKTTPCQLVFLGDSITALWAAQPLFNKEFAKYKPLNFGIGGDRTENVLWRLQHGAFDVVRPKVVVLLIGTNNLNANSAQEILEGVKAIIAEVRSRSPQTKFLLLGLFPRDEKPGTPFRTKIKELNQLLAGLADNDSVRYLEFGEKFLEPDGSLTRETMMDFVHPAPRGYQIWADNIREPLAEMMSAADQADTITPPTSEQP